MQVGATRCSVICENTALLETQGPCESVCKCSADTETDDTSARVENVTTLVFPVSSPCLLSSLPVFKLHFTIQQRRSSVFPPCRCTDMSCAPAVLRFKRRQISELDDVQAFGVHAVCHVQAARASNYLMFHRRSVCTSALFAFLSPAATHTSKRQTSYTLQ